MNIAFLGKLGWRLVTERDSLWAQILNTKYKHPTVEDHNFSWKQRASNLWKGIHQAGEVLKESIRRTCSGRSIFFWRDRWLYEVPLSQIATKELTEYDMKRRAIDYWIAGKGWDWDTLKDLLPEKALNDLSYYMLDAKENDEVF